MEDIRSPNASSTTIVAISDWREEVEQFKQFIYLHHGVDKNGLELVNDGSVKVLRVVNKRDLLTPFMLGQNPFVGKMTSPRETPHFWKIANEILVLTNLRTADRALLPTADFS